jgi:NADP-dependent 3-hydroxy acid dehydrogenase YdfG
MGSTDRRTALIAGASSGVGAATARALARLGLSLALVARREERLRELTEEIRATGGTAVFAVADVSRPDACQRAVEAAVKHVGSVDVLVNAAGTNVPNRRLDNLAIDDWDAIIATNLSGAFYLVRAVLPAMRSRRRGLIVHISSVAGLQPSALSGAAYSASKAGLNALSACTNLEEGTNGVRSCVILPGDIDTELLDRRPQPPDTGARAHMLRAEDVAALVVAAVQMPPGALLESMTVRPAG